MNLPNKNFCVLPWVSLEASPIGTIRPCCLADDELRDDHGQKFNLRTAQFGEVQNCQDLQDLRQQFLAGNQPKTCRKCWSEESAGRTSKRLHTLDRLKHMLPDQVWTMEAKPLMFLDLKLGNICNLKCRICGSWSSSTFASEELAHVTKDRKQSFHYQMLRAGAWPRENAEFWSQIDQVSDQLRYLEFTGGEPFMIAEHFDLLQGLVDRGLAHNIEIHYNTNGTQWPEIAAEIWRHFRLVEVAFSIDDLGPRFEYQRSGADWTQVQDNLQRFGNLRRHLPNLRLQVCSTVNVFNVMYLEVLAHWIDQQNFDFVYWNIMHDAPYFSIAALPESAKQIIAKRLTQAQVSAPHRREFNRIQDFMLQGTSLPVSHLHEQIRRLDTRRGENLAEAAPELAQAIGYTAT